MMIRAALALSLAGELGGAPDAARSAPVTGEPAQSTPEPAEELRSQPPGWSFALEPFVWLAGIEGHGSADSSPPADISENLSPFGEFDGGFLLAFEARSPDGGCSLFGDGLILALADEEGSVETATDALMLEAGIGLPLGSDSGWEAIAGLRYVDLDYEVDLLGAVSASAHKDWVDPWVGARGTIPIVEGWKLGLRADVGGFGVGTELSWQGLAALQVALGQSMRLDLGYRAISLDFEGGDLKYDALVSGPLVGLAIRW